MSIEYCFNNVFGDVSLDCALMENPSVDPNLEKENPGLLAKLTPENKQKLYKCIDDQVKANPRLCNELPNYGCTSSTCQSINDQRPLSMPENPFDFCNNGVDSSYENQDIISNCCGSNQNNIGKFSQGCQAYFDAMSDIGTPDVDAAGSRSNIQLPYCQEAGIQSNPVFAKICANGCGKSANIDECIIKHIDDLKTQVPLDELCGQIDISAAGNGSENSLNYFEKGYGRGCFLCKFCDVCGPYNSDMCKDVVKMPNSQAISSMSLRSDNKSESVSNTDIGLFVVGSALLVVLLIYLYKRK